MKRLQLVSALCLISVLLLSMAAGAVTRTPTWSYTIGSPVASAPSIYQGNAYFGADDGKMYCLGIADGSLKWSHDCQADARAYIPGDTTTLRIRTRPGIYGPSEGLEKIFVTATNGYALALNMDGTKKWIRHPTTDENGTPALWEGFVYFGNSGQVHRLFASSGLVSATSEAYGLLIESSVSIPGTDLIWFGSTNGYIYCLMYEEGTDGEPGFFSPRLQKAVDPDNPKAVISSPYVDIRPGMGGAVLYIGTGNNDIRCMNATSFGDLWKVETGGPVDSSPWFDAGTQKVVVGCDDGKIYVLDGKDPMNTTKSPRLLGTFQAENPLKASPVVVGNTIYIADLKVITDAKGVIISKTSKLYAVGLNDLQLKWTADFTGALTSTSLGEANGHSYIVFGCEDGKVYGFDLTE